MVDIDFVIDIELVVDIDFVIDIVVEFVGLLIMSYNIQYIYHIHV